MSLLFVIATFCYTNLTAQVRILKLDPATNSVTLKNFGSSNAPISGYWFCDFPVYGAVNEMTTVTSLDPGEDVNIASSQTLQLLMVNLVYISLIALAQAMLL